MESIIGIFALDLLVHWGIDCCVLRFYFSNERIANVTHTVYSSSSIGSEYEFSRITTGTTEKTSSSVLFLVFTNSLRRVTADSD